MVNQALPKPRFDTEDISQSKGNAHVFDHGFTGLVWFCALSVAIILCWLGLVVFQDARPAIEKFHLSFLFSQDWHVSENKFGGLPYIYGSIVSSFIALIFSVPLGLSVAILTSENLLPDWIKTPIGFMVELIASIPSVIVGLWGIFVFIPLFNPLQNGYLPILLGYLYSIPNLLAHLC